MTGCHLTNYINEGETEAGTLNAYISLLMDGFISLAEAAKRLDLSESELQKCLQKTNA